MCHSLSRVASLSGVENETGERPPDSLASSVENLRPSRPDRATAPLAGLPASGTMAIMPKPSDSPPPRPSAAEERAERLAAELRANLRRRKEQARGREAAVFSEDDVASTETAKDESRR